MVLKIFLSELQKLFVENEIKHEPIVLIRKKSIIKAIYSVLIKKNQIFLFR